MASLEQAGLPFNFLPFPLRVSQLVLCRTFDIGPLLFTLLDTQWVTEHTGMPQGGITTVLSSVGIIGQHS